jgi:DNA polymerase III delta prime subunit
MTLITKYLLKSFKEFEEEKKEIISLLQHFMAINFLSVILVGPSGCGKTLLIEVLLSEFNQGTENILRINSLKEQGIHYYRNELKHFCQNISTHKKFVVIDDIDFLNDQSQQVIRNCIQKHSQNIHFIASCTNSQKVLDTLTTMLLPITIPPVTSSLLEKVLKKIVENEKIQIDNESKNFILTTRKEIKSVINDLHKCQLYGEPVNFEIAKDLLCDINMTLFETFTTAAKKNDLFEATKILFSLHDDGFSVTDILYNYYTFVKYFSRDDDLIKYKITKIITKFTTTFHTIHEDMIELALFVNNINRIYS